jgi:hypothetical protein
MLVRRVLPAVAVVCFLAGLVGLVFGVATERIIPGPALVNVPFGVVGVLLGVRRPRHPIGWLLIAVGATPALTAIVSVLAPGFDWAVELQNGLLIAGLAVVLVLFPTGTPPARWWLVPMTVVVVSWVGMTRLGVITLAGDFELYAGVVLAGMSLVVCLAAPIVRLRRASGIERSQLRWLGAAAGFTGAAMIVGGAGVALDVEFLAGLGGFVFLLGATVGIPGSILVAILRYRLYDIERIVSRTVTYSVVALLVSLVYAVPVLVAPRILGSSSAPITAAATLAAVVAFSPLLRRVRRVVDRRFNRSAYDAAREAERFAVQIRDAVDLDTITGQLAAVVRTSLHPSGMTVWVHRA